MGLPASIAEWAREGEAVTMRRLQEITSDGDIIDDGEIHALFDFDPEALISDPIE